MSWPALNKVLDLQESTRGIVKEWFVHDSIGWFRRNKKQVYTNCTGDDPIILHFESLDNFQLFGFKKDAMDNVQIEMKVVQGDVAVIMRSEKLSNKALFVIPSQFNSVEYPNSATKVKHVQAYTNDFTGGPVAQLAADVGLAQCLLDMADKLNSIPFVYNEFLNLQLQNGYKSGFKIRKSSRIH